MGYNRDEAEKGPGGEYLEELCHHGRTKKICIYCKELAAYVATITDLKQQVANLEEYMLKGVAFRDELQARVKELDLREAARRGGNYSAPIVCICGSTRFKQAWIAENTRLTGEGNIVLAVGLWGHHERVFPDEATKKKLDELHLRKIDLCDWVWVLDIGGYIGESTRNEIAYAESYGKTIRHLSKEIPDYAEPVDPLQSRLAALEKVAEHIIKHQHYMSIVDAVEHLRAALDAAKEGK